MKKSSQNNETLYEMMNFALIGAFVTFCGVVLMFLFYNVFQMGYWGSSAFSYFICSLVSFFFNKWITFKNKTAFSKTIFKFFINITVCYVFAYLLAQPAMRFFLNNWQINEKEIVDQSAFIAGAILFTCLNFIGQKYFVFKKGENFSL